MRAILGFLVLVASATAAAAPADDLGAAFAAYDANDLDGARARLAKLGRGSLANADYAAWLRGMVALRIGDGGAAEAAFRSVPASSRFAPMIPWRLADAWWVDGQTERAARAYAKLVDAAGAGELGDVGTAKFRIADTATGPSRLAALRRFLIEHPAHPLAAQADARLRALGGKPLTVGERIERAKNLTSAHLWDEAVAELALLPAKLAAPLARQRDYWLGTTLFKMRRRYADAAALLLRVYPEMGDSAAEAMFHGARALSRADRDDDAIVWYRKVVATYPRTAWSEEAAFLAGWLELNRGRYKEAIAPLEDSLARYPRTKWVDDALWYLGLSHYMLGDWARARTRLEALAKRGGSLEGGKGMYWLARIDERLGDASAATAGYVATIRRYPFSWYALLAHARLAARGADVPPFGVADPPARGSKLADRIDPKIERDELIVRVDELIAAGLTIDAGHELVRAERAFLGRHDRSSAFAVLLDRFRRAGNFHRPWMLAVSHHGGALDGPPTGDAKRWWAHAYPRAYDDLITTHQHLGANPTGYLHSIMRKESGFDPHVLSYADAQGLLQMIPATTRRVAKALGLPYDAGRLYEPAYNVQVASWYIGRLLQKFKGQVPLGAGSFNSGPRPVMRWLDQYGDREIDELVELVPYTQTREYMKKVTENFARYQYLYENKVYLQPLVVDKRYLDDRLTY